MSDDEDWEDAADKGAFDVHDHEAKLRQEREEQENRERQLIEEQSRQKLLLEQQIELQKQQRLQALKSITPLPTPDDEPSETSPKIIILKRPNNNSQNPDGADAIKPKVLIKPRAEREADYAAARARILGTLSPQSGTPGTSPPVIPGLLRSKSDSNSTSSITLGTSVKKTVFEDNDGPVVRQPCGPDGSTGFSLKRG